MQWQDSKSIAKRMDTFTSNLLNYIHWYIKLGYLLR